MAFLRIEWAWQKAGGLARWRDDPRLAIDLDRFGSRAWHRRAWVAAAAGLASLAVALAGWLLFFDAGAATYAAATGNGEVERVRLAEGSTVHLNHRSEIRVELSEVRRLMTLVRGEAYFEVSHDASRPFEVRAADNVIRALGTAFSVRLVGPKQVDVLVSEGAIVVRPPQLYAGADTAVRIDLPESIRKVSAGYGATVVAGEIAITPVAPAHLARRLAWADGWISMTGLTLAQVVEEFNRYHTPAWQMVIVDPEIATLPVGGRVRLQDPQSFLASLEHWSGVHAETDASNNQIVQLRLKERPRSDSNGARLPD
jgi:transmembrane sensor